MLLMYGKATVDTRGLPRIAVMNSHGSSDGTTLYVLLESRTRGAVEKWAKRLGVEVVESGGSSAGEREVRAEAESDGSSCTSTRTSPSRRLTVTRPSSRFGSGRSRRTARGGSSTRSRPASGPNSSASGTRPNMAS